MTRVIVGALLLLAALHTTAAELRGVVVGIAEGDTLTVLDGDNKQHRIRLAGIDAPEKQQTFFKKSRQNLSDLAFKKQATLDCYRTDGLKRKVCRVSINGKDVALAQVQAGLAWHYKQFEKEQTPSERAAYARAEADARASRIGLWQHERPVAPWDFRRHGVK